MEAFISHYLITYELPALFIGAALFGETVLVAAVLLAAEGVWSMPLVFFVFLIGTVLADALWFLFGRNVMLGMDRFKRLRQRYENYLAAFEMQSHHSLFFSILLFKFLHGTRIITTVYVSLNNISFATFILFDVIATVLWLVVFMGAGLLFWTSLTAAAPWVRSPLFAIGAFVVFAIITHFATMWLSKRYLKRSVTTLEPPQG